MCEVSYMVKLSDGRDTIIIDHLLAKAQNTQ